MNLVDDSHDELEAIYELVKNYNKGEYRENAVLQEALDRIVGSKRRVEITIFYHDKENRMTVIPIPLTLLLLSPYLIQLLGAYGRRRRGEDVLTLLPETHDQPPREIFPTDAKVPDEFLNRFALCREGVSTEQWEKYQEASLIDDLYLFMYDNPTRRRGLNYPDMIKELAGKPNAYGNSHERMLKVTHALLGQWRAHDLAARREAGIDEREIEVGLNYAEQNEQIRWAYAHVEHLIELAEAYRSNPRQFVETLQERVDGLRERRAARNTH